MKVEVTVIGRRTADGDTDVTELTLPGLMRQTADGYEVRYRQEEDGCRIDTLMRMADGVMEVERRGDAKSLLRLQVGKRLESRYDTGYGSLPMAVDTHRLEWDLSETGGRIDMVYRMELGGSITADHELTVTVKAVEE